MIDDIVHEADFFHPPERVWRALTDPRCLGAWLMETTFSEAVAGHAFRFQDRPRPFWDGVYECEVAEADLGRHRARLGRRHRRDRGRHLHRAVPDRRIVHHLGPSPCRVQAHRRS